MFRVELAGLIYSIYHIFGNILITDSTGTRCPWRDRQLFLSHTGWENCNILKFICTHFRLLQKLS